MTLSINDETSAFRLLSPPIPRSRFSIARDEAAARATLIVAANVLEEAENRVQRARALIQQAVSMDAAARANALGQAAQSLREAEDELTDVLGEI